MRKYIAEGVGTMFLTLLACGVASVLGCNTIQGVFATAFAFGLVIVAAAYSIGNVSGCHINPAVSIAFTVTGKMKIEECIKYIVAQIIGAFVGSLLLAACLKGFTELGANSYNEEIVNVWIALLVEIILTFIFVTVILSVTDKKENSHVAGIVIGLTLTLVHLFGIPFTGTSVNPARSLAPAVLQGGGPLKQVWVFLTAPIIGAVFAGLFYKYVLKTNKK